MTPSDFKSWFEGFTEALSGAPTKAQWARIKERVAEIDGKPVTDRVYIDRYYRQYWTQPSIYPTYPYQTVWGSAVGLGSLGQNSNALAVSNMNALGGNASFDSGVAMSALGRADALAVA